MEFMLRKRTIFSTFLIVFFLSALLLILANFGILNSFSSILSKLTFPVQKNIYKAFGSAFSYNSNTRLNELEEDNLNLNKKIVDQRKLENDNKALRDQFAVTKPRSTILLPAKVIGFPSFIPNLSFPETILIDKGSDDGLRVGQAVVFKDNLIGKISKITANKSSIELITHPNSTFTAKVLNSKSEGVVKGLGGGEMILDNVLLSDSLKTSELVLTKGSLTIDNTGFPADLIVGKIIAIDKNPSALFQSAGIKSLVDFSSLETVFIYLENN